LPLGCSIVLEKKDKRNYSWKHKKSNISLNVNQLITKIINFQHQTNLPFTLNNFITLNHISIETIYKKKDSWSRLQRAGVIEGNINEKQHIPIFTNSTSYLISFKLAKQDLELFSDFNENEKIMLVNVALWCFKCDLILEREYPNWKIKF
jgi:hypothetical protein